MKILYLEDNLEFRRRTIGTCLKDHEVTEASDGQEGKELFNSCQFDLILLDYEMIRVHGPEVLDYIREADSTIPVIAVSMDDRLNDRLLRRGATCAVPKRRITELTQVIQSLAG